MKDLGEEKRTLTLKNSFRQHDCNFNDLNEIGKTLLGECHWTSFKSGLRNGKREPIQLKLKKKILMMMVILGTSGMRP